jgi:hypothetical protein
MPLPGDFAVIETKSTKTGPQKQYDTPHSKSPGKMLYYGGITPVSDIGSRVHFCKEM